MKEPVVIVVSEHELVRPRYRPASRWPARTLGVVVTVFAHLLISAPLILGTASQKKHQPTPDGMGTAAWASEGDQSEYMILLDLSAMSSIADQELTQPNSMEDAMAPDELKLVLAAFEPQPPRELVIEEEAADDEETVEAAGDPAGQAKLFGNYMGQVAARIERAWMRPRTPIETGRFECRARVIQDRRGFVLSIGLENCSSDERWRQSLTTAIQMASPLSAPADPRLFSESLTLNFSADQFTEGSTPEYAYEPLARHVAQRAPVDSPQSTMPASGDAELTIIGDRVIWKSK